MGKICGNSVTISIFLLGEVMGKCLLCKTKLTDGMSKAIAEVEKPEELQFNKAKTVRANICTNCVTNPQVIRYKLIKVDPKWIQNPKHRPQHGKPPIKI
ncbi:Uncharacterised protein [uncultured archaeon]|nr:Uncharacterised protein [uncultured archaeon]